MREQGIAIELGKFLRQMYCIDMKTDYMNGLSDELGVQLFNPRSDLMGAFKIGFAKYYRNSTNEFKEKSGEFLLKYDEYNKLSIDDIGEEKSEKMVAEFKSIIKEFDATI